MSDTATAPAPSASAAAPQSTPAAPAASVDVFAPPTQQAPPASTTPPAFFGEGTFKEGWTDPYKDKFPALAKLQNAKDPETGMKMINDAFAQASRRELKGDPNESWAPDEVARYRESRGIPENPADYAFKPDNLPDGYGWEDSKGEAVNTWAHKNHIPKAAIDELKGLYGSEIEDFANRARAKYAEIQRSYSAQSKALLEKEWGADFNDRIGDNVDYLSVKFTPEEMADPLLAAALRHPKILMAFDENRRNWRGQPLVGQGKENVAGTESKYSQAMKLMATPLFKQGDAATTKQVSELFEAHAQEQLRKK